MPYFCAICQNNHTETSNNVSLQCSHTFCTYCIANWCRHHMQAPCPLCRNTISGLDKIKIAGQIALDNAKSITTPICDLIYDSE